jgi:hypothetical protein
MTPTPKAKALLHNLATCLAREVKPRRRKPPRRSPPLLSPALSRTAIVEIHLTQKKTKRGRKRRLHARQKSQLRKLRSQLSHFLHQLLSPSLRPCSNLLIRYKMLCKTYSVAFRAVLHSSPHIRYNPLQTHLAYQPSLRITRLVLHLNLQPRIHLAYRCNSHNKRQLTILVSLVSLSRQPSLSLSPNKICLVCPWLPLFSSRTTRLSNLRRPLK